MGVSGKTRTVSSVVSSSAELSRRLKNGYFPGMMEFFIDGDLNQLFNGKTKIGFSVIDSFCFNPRTGELLVASRYEATHEETIKQYGESDPKEYVLGYINFPGSSRDIPLGWMTDMMKDRTISVRYEGSFMNKDDYNHVQRALNLIENYGAPKDYPVLVLFGESKSGRGGFLDDRPEGTKLKYNNIHDRELVF